MVETGIYGAKRRKRQGAACVGAKSSGDEGGPVPTLPGLLFLGSSPLPPPFRPPSPSPLFFAVVCVCVCFYVVQFFLPSFCLHMLFFGKGVLSFVSFPPLLRWLWLPLLFLLRLLLLLLLPASRGTVASIAQVTHSRCSPCPCRPSSPSSRSLLICVALSLLYRPSSVHSAFLFRVWVLCHQLRCRGWVLRRPIPVSKSKAEHVGVDYDWYRQSPAHI